VPGGLWSVVGMGRGSEQDAQAGAVPGVQVLGNAHSEVAQLRNDCGTVGDVPVKSPTN
jgi:hypothetical protein